MTKYTYKGKYNTIDFIVLEDSKTIIIIGCINNFGYNINISNEVFIINPIDDLYIENGEDINPILLLNTEHQRPVTRKVINSIEIFDNCAILKYNIKPNCYYDTANNDAIIKR